MRWKIRKRKYMCTNNWYGHISSCIYSLTCCGLRKREDTRNWNNRTRFGGGLWTCRKTDYGMNEWLDERMNEWKDELMKGWMDILWEDLNIRWEILMGLVVIFWLNSQQLQTLCCRIRLPWINWHVPLKIQKLLPGLRRYERQYYSWKQLVIQNL